MTLQEYISQLIQKGRETKGNMELEVVYSSDDEGNCFSPVQFAPTVGKFNNGNFDVGEANSICIN